VRGWVGVGVKVSESVEIAPSINSFKRTKHFIFWADKHVTLFSGLINTSLERRAPSTSGYTITSSFSG
jgi:hypothetical protein